jgi:hypothetical protein
MQIAVINLSTRVDESAIYAAIRAVNRQIENDFAPYWHVHGSLRLEGKIGTQASKKKARYRGDAMIYILDSCADSAHDFGYHEVNHRGVPCGFVYIDLASKLTEPWTVSLSHEALEILADPEVNRLIQGPHPGKPRRQVFHWLEICDPVQNEIYEIDGIALSDFVLPLYYTRREEIDSRNDFLGRADLRSFGLCKGGYLGFFDPKTQAHEIYTGPANATGKKRARIKEVLQSNRRALRNRTR